jgi:hypothetical protein
MVVSIITITINIDLILLSELMMRKSHLIMQIASFAIMMSYLYANTSSTVRANHASCPSNYHHASSGDCKK